MYINLFLIILLGEVGLVLYAVLIKIRNLLRVHIKGLGRGLMSVTGHLYGAKKIDDLNKMYSYALKCSIIISAVISIAFFFYPIKYMNHFQLLIWQLPFFILQYLE